ncbi:MAG: hypothetical protein Kow00124_04940 [Anaerolineae bacterium]
MALAILHLCLLAVDWGSLLLLPRLRRSYGPALPPALALTTTRAALSGLAGLIVWAAAPRHTGGWLIGIGLLHLAITALTQYGLWIEPFRLQVTHVRLASPRLDPTARPVRLLHIGDLHTERLSTREERLQRLIDALQPDVIVFSGDLINLSYQNDPASWEDVQAVIRRWEAPYGVYAISGTPLVESAELFARLIEGSRLRWLRDEWVPLDIHGQQIALLGVTCAHNNADDARRMQQVAAQAPTDRFRLLLFHSPDIAPQAAEAGIDLYLCGHTHGGQVRLPLYGALITSSSLGKRFEMGRYAVGEMTLYVTRGIGVEGGSAPRARLFCPPEITLWTLEGVPESAHAP